MLSNKVSVIVPVYKVEKCLENCIQSILNQTYQNFELILIDDGSPDQCPGMCDEYAKKYERIRVIHQKNGGLSDARNTGIKMASGSMVTFVDSDDYINPLYLELLIHAKEKLQCEMSVCGFQCVFDSTSITQVNRKIVRCWSCSGKEALANILYQKFRDVSASGLLIPTSLARKFLFPKGKYIEDLYTTYKYYLNVDNVAFVEVPLYYYFQRLGSIMHSNNTALILDMINASDLIVEKCGFDALLEKAAINKRFSNYRANILQIDYFKEKYPIKYQKILDTLKKDKWKILKDKEASWQNKLSALFLIFGIPGLHILYLIKRILENKKRAFVSDRTKG